MISMKGIELPISTIVVVVLVLIVLIAIIGLFYTTWPPGAQTATLESVKDNACSMLSSMGGCNPTGVGTQSVSINNFDADKDGKIDPGSGEGTADAANVDYCKNTDTVAQDNLFNLCKCWFGVTGSSDTALNYACKTQVCHCQS